MKWQLPWKRQTMNHHAFDEEFSEHSPSSSGTTTSPFVEPFRPLYDIPDANQENDYSVRPLYTPSSTMPRNSLNQRISTASNPYPLRNHRSSRSGFERFPTRSRYGNHPRRMEEEESQSLLTYQWIGAIVLVGALFLAFHSSSPFAQRIQTAVSTTMQNDYNLSGVTAWVQSHLQKQPSTAPATAALNGSQLPQPANQNLASANGNQQAGASVQTKQTATNDSSLQGKAGGATSSGLLPPPLDHGKISSDFKQDTQQEMILTGASGGAVYAVAAGVVAAVDHNAQQGTYVLLDNGSIGKTLYAHLGTVSIKLNDKVTQGQTIGTLDKNGQTADMYFGYIKNGKYENPHTIIQFP
ncbi:M23 family metallopeptidase [Fodinisporobacter ferrooxydans]|uniref:M23 family metallopeptidase n=1 Tax=Fodinisporobacter ferrooxydans TaxID=2901836 RepID=A0ABY4CHZ6_9BACL|nr:M23 family metallopeptidase [Alicyclobacillaceae bacterium MYW30-H2]